MLKAIFIHLLAEEWREHPGYDGRFIVSSLGRIKSTHGNTQPAKLRKLRVSGRPGFGYLSLEICIDYTYKTRPVHQMVLETFKGLRGPGQTQSRHLNGNRFNNADWNLSWGTWAENRADRCRHEGIPVERQCSMPNCGKKHLARGLCHHHYWAKHRKPRDRRKHIT